MQHGLVDSDQIETGQQSGASSDHSTGGSEVNVDEPAVIIQTQNDHRVVLTAFDLLMIATLAGLFTSTVVAVSEVFR